MIDEKVFVGHHGDQQRALLEKEYHERLRREDTHELWGTSDGGVAYVQAVEESCHISVDDKSQ